MPQTAMTMPLYPSEEQIGRAVLGERWKEWPSIAVLDERKGLPKIDPVHGGRYWPAVCKFYDIVNEVGVDYSLQGGGADESQRLRRIRVVPLAPDGQEDPDGEKAAALRGRRRERRPLRTRPADRS